MGVIITRWVVAPALALAAGILIISNVVLQSGTVRGWFERKLERRSGLEWTIGSLSWTPWSGMQVRDIVAEMRGEDGEGMRPLYQADVDVQPHWGALLEGSLELKEVRLRSGTVAVPIELLALLPEDKEKVAAKKKAVVKPDSPDPDPKDPPKEREPKSKKVAKRKKPAPSERPPAKRPMKLIIERCEVSLYSIEGQGKGGFALKNLRAELPLQGEDEGGWLEIDGIALGGKTISGALRVEVEWRRPLLLLPSTSFEWAGLDLQTAGSLRLSGTPRFVVRTQVPTAPLKKTPLELWSGMEVEAGQVLMSGQLAGNLTDPKSWRGDALLQAVDLTLDNQRRGETRAFELARVSTVMQDGAFQIVDARLLSEPLSFLGNGVVLSDGRVRGVMRVVADREHAEVITRFAVGALLTGGWTRSWFEPLITPDRQFRDLHVQGTLSRAVVDVGRKGEELEINQVWSRMVAFVKDEVEETERGILPTPRDSLLPQ